MDWAPLLEAATAARTHAYVPYSHFCVGSAVLMGDGSIHSGCNIENRSYGLTICAERAALAHAVTAGQQKLTAVVVLTDTDPPSTPCGMCLDSLAEFGDRDVPVLLANTQGQQEELRLGDLIPRPFVYPSE